MADLALGVRGRRAIAAPGLLLKLVVLAVLLVLVAAPLLRIALATLTPNAVGAWADVTVSRLSDNLLWEPLLNTLF